ncbi:MAG: ral secretion pathway protein [Variovorax sp.]|nr:ral secretion pathway protein [Variovorax sp.]
MGSTRGFTLVELLVALVVMALLALVSWRGLEGLSRATTQNRQRADAVLTLQVSLAQWGADLDAIATLAQTRPIDWDGRVLRLTRRGPDPAAPAMVVVAWTLRAEADGARWHRWQSAPFTLRGDWQQAWSQAAAWAQDGTAPPGGSDVALMPLESWQLYYFRNDQWGPAAPLTATPLVAATAATAATANAAIAPGAVPDGVRLVLGLSPGEGLSGPLTRDWARPTLTVSKS